MKPHVINFDRARAVIPNQADTKFFSRHKSLGCQSFCVNERSHFIKWKRAYQDNLRRYFLIFSKGFKVDFEDFAEFAFCNSSGYISPFC